MQRLHFLQVSLKLSGLALMLLTTSCSLFESREQMPSLLGDDQDWLLYSFGENASGQKILPPAGQLYGIAFQEGNKFVSVNDCNGIAGEYKSSDNGTFEVVNATTSLVGCFPGSMNLVFGERLGGAYGYEMRQDTLILSSDIGVLVFVPVPGDKTLHQLRLEWLKERLKLE